MLKKIAEAISKADNIALLPHISADGDAIGSSLALAIVLSGTGKKVSVLVEESIPQTYCFLPGKELSCIYSGQDMQYDMAIALDCGDIGRLGSRRAIFDKAPITANIDHHPTNNGFALHDHVNTSASATGEIIFRLLEQMDIKPDKDAAICLYTAITSDTGGFRYSNTTPETLIICSELLKTGVDSAEISKSIFETTTLGRVKLTGEAINSLKLYESGKIAVMILSQEALKRSGASEDDNDGIINTARNIRGVEAAAVLREMDNGDIKVSLRSNDYVDVSVIARRHNGGGHKRAAGFTKKGDELVKAASELIKDIKGML